MEVTLKSEDDGFAANDAVFARLFIGVLVPEAGVELAIVEEELVLLLLFADGSFGPPFQAVNVYLNPVNDFISMGAFFHFLTGAPDRSRAFNAMSPVFLEEPVPPEPPAAIEVDDADL